MVVRYPKINDIFWWKHKEVYGSGFPATEQEMELFPREMKLPSLGVGKKGAFEQAIDHGKTTRWEEDWNSQKPLAY